MAVHKSANLQLALLALQLALQLSSLGKRQLALQISSLGKRQLALQLSSLGKRQLPLQLSSLGKRLSAAGALQLALQGWLCKDGSMVVITY